MELQLAYAEDLSQGLLKVSEIRMMYISLHIKHVNNFFFRFSFRITVLYPNMSVSLTAVSVSLSVVSQFPSVSPCRYLFLSPSLFCPFLFLSYLSHPAHDRTRFVTGSPQELLCGPDSADSLSTQQPRPVSHGAFFNRG